MIFSLEIFILRDFLGLELFLLELNFRGFLGLELFYLEFILNAFFLIDYFLVEFEIFIVRII